MKTIHLRITLFFTLAALAFALPQGEEADVPAADKMVTPADDAVVSSASNATNVRKKTRPLTPDERLRKNALDWAYYFRDRINEMSPPFFSYTRVMHPNMQEWLTVRADCSGYITAIYSNLGISFVERDKRMNVVTNIYKMFKEAGKLYCRTRPRKGDAIFFDNCWDRNYNGKYDDALNHIGIVASVDTNDTITFYHCSSYGLGHDSAVCVKAYANIRLATNEFIDGKKRESFELSNLKEGELVNTTIREAREGDPAETEYLAGALIRCFGAIGEVPKEGDRFVRERYRTRVIPTPPPLPPLPTPPPLPRHTPKRLLLRFCFSDTFSSLGGVLPREGMRRVIIF